MRSSSQLKTTGFDAFDQLWVGSLHPRNHNSDIRHLKQWQIIGRVPESQDLDITTSLLLLQCFESPAFADAVTEKMSHAVPLDNRESILLNHGDQAIPA